VASIGAGVGIIGSVPKSQTPSRSCNKEFVIIISRSRYKVRDTVRLVVTSNHLVSLSITNSSNVCSRSSGIRRNREARSNRDRRGS
jgi:hypothetical protein